MLGISSQEGHKLALVPILWYSKQQNMVEAPTFGSEFIAMQTCLEAVEAKVPPAMP